MAPHLIQCPSARIFRVCGDWYNMPLSCPLNGTRRGCLIERVAGVLSASIALSRTLFSRSPALQAPERVLYARGLEPMAKRWYVIHAYSNFEGKVADSIREQAKHRHLEHLFEEIIVPTEKLVDIRGGQKHEIERKFFPGYVLVKMELTDEVYQTATPAHRASTAALAGAGRMFTASSGTRRR
jgi:hypothetical protein